MRSVMTVACLVVAIATSSGRSQPLTPPAPGEILGTVIDASGGSIPGAIVTLSGPQPRRAVSDEDGGFCFSAVPPGAYTVTTSLAGFTTTCASRSS